MIHIEVGKPTHIASDDLASLRLALIESGNRSDKPIHKAGTYIIGNETEVIYVGEGGPGKPQGTGTMGHRIFQHIKQEIWMSEARIIFLVPIIPAEYSCLGEQEALALHFHKEQRLPKYNLRWC
jgi:hypothetical protein